MSFSNPVRQSLFTFEDCLKGGRNKAEAAVKMLTSIYPMVQAKAVNLTVPMPGHPVSGSLRKEVEKNFGTLDELIKM